LLVLAQPHPHQVHLVRDALLKPPGGVAPPPAFEPYNAQLYALLSRATANSGGAGGKGGSGQRMDVARESFQTLLNVSLHESDSASASGSAGGSGMLVAPSASMDALLKSCEDVLRRYVTDEVAMAGEEMPADRTAEAVYVQHPPPAFFLGFRTIFCGVVQK
jgi:hypothetical protein